MNNSVAAFAPINIALVKYWGKRDLVLNLPNTPSLSLTLGSKGAYVELGLSDRGTIIVVNDNLLAADSENYRKIVEFVSFLAAENDTNLNITITTNIPVAAGFASSAAIYAALTKAVAKLYSVDLSATQLSLLARQGSGSACRSFWPGFVEWRKGEVLDGSDSHGVPLNIVWPELRVGLLVISDQQKPISSREAMQQTVLTSELYEDWPVQVEADMIKIKQALNSKDFSLLGTTAEENAIAMHKTMLAATPSINYSLPETIEAQKKVIALRKQGIEVYFTQDAGPNLKLLFLAENSNKVSASFQSLEVIAPFADPTQEQVILVDEKDRELGVVEKMAAHKNAQLHRAISVMVYRKNGKKIELLLQQRQLDKYHCGGMWANTCCSHPRPGEDALTAAHRRLQEEMGFDTELRSIGSVLYKAEFTNGLTEYEFDHIFIGTTGLTRFEVNRAEVNNYEWVEFGALQQELRLNPAKYTNWLPLVLQAMGK